MHINKLVKYVVQIVRDCDTGIKYMIYAGPYLSEQKENYAINRTLYENTSYITMCRKQKHAELVFISQTC